MADVVISFAVEIIIPTLREKLREVGGVETDVENIRDELDRMTAFLKDADSAMDNCDTGMINWVNQVRDVAHDIEDVLDKIVLGLKKNHQGNSVLGLFLKYKALIRVSSVLQKGDGDILTLQEVQIQNQMLTPALTLHMILEVMPFWKKKLILWELRAPKAS
ncbi:putative disease resistance protein At1g50180 [Olea europaea var. sylvestris]|uniref:putative disease resistance protein At1g50180 n=1 Tax=Olea europaea var. sylvestris TaxID=158386 RepID=UPI000C1D1CCF|nr:putative disease resistance protein At1g50180 [Olea europaea var. sylvestris]